MVYCLRLCAKIMDLFLDLNLYKWTQSDLFSCTDFLNYWYPTEFLINATQELQAVANEFQRNLKTQDNKE